MIKSCRTLVVAAVAAMIAGAGWNPLRAQGVTTGGISGVVTDSTGTPIENAQIQVVNRSTGATTGTLTRESGRFNVQGLEVGGPYSITARLIGYAPQTRDNITVTLGQAIRADFRLGRQAVEIAAVTIQAASENAVISPSRTGVGTSVSDSAISRLPTLNRNFTDFVALTPQISTAGPGLSAGGVSNRYNSIQIDGASETDLFGLGSTGQPGGQANGKSISIEAVKEYQVLLSPFDVRQGNFAGALINAVTKSGTNDFHGSAFYVTRSEKLARDVPFIRAAPFEQTQYGVSLGGPIIKDKLHFFVVPEWQARKAPAAGPYLGQPASSTVPIPVTQQAYDRFLSLLQGYGVAPGTGNQVTNKNPLSNFFGRVDAQLPFNSRLVLRYNYGQAQDDNLFRTGTNNTAFRLTSNSYQFKSTKNAPTALLYTNFANGSYNELIVGYNQIRDRRAPASKSPSITVLNIPSPAGGTGSLIAGAENSSQGNELDQDIFEVTDNFTYPIGAHRLTVGTKNQFYKVRNLFGQNSYGNYTFGTLDSLALGAPRSYQIGLRLGGDVAARFKASNIGLYVQDEWAATSTFNLTAGLRVDVPNISSRPGYNAVVDTFYHVRTDVIPQNNYQISPRLGFNWDVTGNQMNQLRGGVGVFSGEPAFVWISNNFSNSGVDTYGRLSCSTPQTSPRFVADATKQPQACVGSGATNRPAVDINVVDKNLKFPTNFRASLGFDRQLPRGFVVTLEGLYTRALNNLFYNNLALKGVTGSDRNGRVLYGDNNAQGNPTPVLVQAGRFNVIQLSNQSEDYSYSMTGGLQKRFTNRFEGSAFYTYGHSYDVQSFSSSVALSNWQFGRAISGRLDDQSLSPAKFDVPHRVVVSGTYSFPTNTDISLIYFGESGVAYDFSYVGDMNFDGSNANDLIYVPKSAADPSEIQFRAIAATASAPAQSVADQQAAFDKYIGSIDCLRSQRGMILKRNSCRSPFTNRLNLTARQTLPRIHGQNLSLQVDIFNFLNFVNKDWGKVYFPVNGTFSNQILTRQATTTGSAIGATGAQGIFTFPTSSQVNSAQNVTSNYQLQIQVRYAF